MEMRELKALELAARSKITWTGEVWLVPSQNGNGTYKVTTWPGAERCECEDYQLRQAPCKHIIAARLVEERDGKRPAPPMDTSAVPTRPTYRQDWKSYNAAQMSEKRRFLALLADLCRGVEEPPQPRTGRRRVPMADMVVASALKVYTTVSSRRFACDLADAHERGHLSRMVHSVTVCAFLESEALTPVLHDLIAQSALPLKAVETTFAVDSTGFSTSRFVRWYDHKYGRDRLEHDWVKAHFACGTRTNVVTGVRIFDRDAADAPQFKPLVEQVGKNFAVQEVSADKAYSSYENLDAVAALGGTPFIAFKANASTAAGGLWERMLSYYLFRRQEFLDHYHRRSNVESTVHMVKSKFRDHCRSKTDTAMKNEVLCKFLCHNLCVLVQSQCELGIEPVFWPDEGKEPRDVLPLARRN